MGTPPASQLRRNYHPDCEAAAQEQIHLELHASYVYSSVASYFRGAAWRPLADLLLQQARDEKEHAEMLIRVHGPRGGRPYSRKIFWLDHGYRGNSLTALERTLNLAMTVSRGLSDLSRLAAERQDPQLGHFLEGHYLQGQEFIRGLEVHVTNLRKAGAPEESDLVGEST